MARKNVRKKVSDERKLKKNYVRNIVLIILFILAVFFIVKLVFVNSVLKGPPDPSVPDICLGGGIFSKFCRNLYDMYDYIFPSPPFPGCIGDNECPSGTTCITALDTGCSAQMTCQECGNDNDCDLDQICIGCACS